jgi:hypothetical protein
VNRGKYNPYIANVSSTPAEPKRPNFNEFVLRPAKALTMQITPGIIPMSGTNDSAASKKAKRPWLGFSSVVIVSEFTKVDSVALLTLLNLFGCTSVARAL